MGTLALIDIPSGYSPTIQPRSLPGLATVGSPIAGTFASAVYSFNMAALANADYECELIGVSVPTRRFYVRKTSTSAFVISTPGGSSVPPPSEPDTCRVRIISTRGATGFKSRIVINSIGDSGRNAERAFANVAYDGLTDNNGLLLVDLPWSSLPGVGNYRMRIYDEFSRTVLHDRTFTVPNTTNEDYEDLE